MTLSLEEIYPFSPASFLHLSGQISYAKEKVLSPYKKPFLLPSTQALLSEEVFAEVALWYHEQGIHVAVRVDKPFEDTLFPEVQQGDSVELFFDTRDIKERGSLHKFCHHFIFLPKEVGGIVACEMTRLRADDSHPLCDPQQLHVETLFGKKSYEMLLFIEKEALYGFDPKSFNRLGFTYRINRKGASAQHFNLSSAEYMIEKYPSLWASLKIMT